MKTDNPESFWKRLMRHKILLAFIAFLLAYMLLDENNYFVTARLYREVADLKAEKHNLELEIQNDSTEALALQDDLEAIERYGRETYYMKRPKEDIYIINTPTPKEKRRALRELREAKRQHKADAKRLKQQQEQQDPQTQTK